MGWWHLPDRSNPALTKRFELYMGRGLAACPAISGALVNGVTGGVGVTPSRGGDGVGGHGESPGAPFPSGGPMWRPQEVVGASVLCPGRGGTHMGTPGVPPSPVSGAWVLLGSFFPQNFGVRILTPFCRCTPKGGWLGAAPCGCRIWGQHPSPDGRSHPMWLRGEKHALGENPSFPGVGLALTPRGWAHIPVGRGGLLAVPAPLQGLGCLGWHCPPRPAVVLSPVATSWCHALSLKEAAERSGKAPGRALGWMRPRELPVHHRATKGFVKSNPPKTPLPNAAGIKRG